MVNYPHNDLFNRGDTERQIQIAFSGGIITNKEMHQGSFELTESLCSEQTLRFGTCEASVLKFKVHNVFTSLVGQTLTVSEILNGNTAEPFYYGKYKVYSDKPTADRKYRDVVAYDAMYDILNADVASWYNSISFPCTIGYFRKKLLSSLKVEYAETELINDGIYIDKTIDAEELSGKQVINAICEINGCFGHINRQGKFEFITLNPIATGLYPSETLYPSEKLYPREANSAELLPTSRYSACKYEDFETKFITGLQIRQEEDDIGATVGTTANVYVVQDNFLVYGKTHDELVTIANNLLSVIDNVYYRPIEYVKTNGKPYLEVGDNISVGSSEVIIETYILERTISGINGQKDEFSAKGTETYGKKLNGLNKQITQLKGKTNKLIRTVDETRSELSDLESETNTRFLQTANEFALSVENLRNETETSLNLLSDKISLKLDAGDVINEINISTEAILLKGNRLVVESTNFSLDENGNCSMTGYIEATGGSIGSLQISPSGFSLGLTGNGTYGYMDSDLLSINQISAYNAYITNLNVTSISGSGVSSIIVNNSLYASGGISSPTVTADYLNATLSLNVPSIECETINGGIPVTQANLWQYLPEINFTAHAAGGYGSYYYSTDSVYASGDNKSIPSIQWVKDYVNERLSS